eukprot:1161067-Pelagomonas_calceolata.AAC.5
MTLCNDQALVGGLHGGLALEIAHFPKLFKRLAVSADALFEAAALRYRESAQTRERIPIDAP